MARPTRKKIYMDLDKLRKEKKMKSGGWPAILNNKKKTKEMDRIGETIGLH